MLYIFPANRTVKSPDCEMFTIPNNNLFQNHHLCLARTEQIFLQNTFVNLANFCRWVESISLGTSREFFCLKKFVGIWTSGSTKCWLIFAYERLLKTLKRRITFLIANETKYLFLVTLSYNQPKCFISKSTVGTRFLFVNLVISTLSLLIIIQ